MVASAVKAVNLRGLRFGMLVATERAPNISRPSGKSPRAAWACRCDCGKASVASAENLRSGNTKSCGCTHGEKHGLRKLPEYSVWVDMHKRCSNTKHKSYHNYGGRGLKVASTWNLFSRFYADMGPRPSASHTLERRKNNLGYSPGNCIWTTRKTQGNNRRGNRLIAAFGRTQTLAQWADETGIKSSTLRNRIESGWSVTDALTQAVR